MKRDGVSTLFIHSYLWALSFLLDHLLLFENVLWLKLIEAVKNIYYGVTKKFEACKAKIMHPSMDLVHVFFTKWLVIQV